MNKDIRKYVSRYVVPFYYDCENKGYDKIRGAFLNNEADSVSGLPKDGQWIKAGFWENYRSDSDSQAEMDIYSYLPSIFSEDLKADGRDDKNLGVSIVYKTNGKLFELEYRKNDVSISFECKDLGVLLFRNGIGFIWYETAFKKDISLEQYVDFQHDFKELARTHSDRFSKKTGFDKEKKEAVYEPFCIGSWLAEIISSEKLGIRFWAERTTEIDGRKINIPDKAVLFQYLFLEKCAVQNSNDILFRVTNGYDDKYNAPDDLDSMLYKPFGNTCFYISKAGMSCVVVNADSNEVFFDGQFREKYIRDYFFIYMLLSYQSYSCAHYSRLLTELPADEQVFNKKTQYVSKLESLNSQINLFMVKSVFDSVSNIHHQNGLYRYGKAELCVEEDIQSLTVGLDALKDIERGKRDRKVDSALIIFGFMVVVSAWIDGLNLIDWFSSNAAAINPWHIGVSIFIVLLTLYLLIILLWNWRKK